MEKSLRKVIYSKVYYTDLQEVYLYGKETFGKVFADIFLEEINHTVSGLSYKFNSYPVCKPLNTKNKIYHNIILGKYLIIYRIKAEKIEVLRIFHGSRSAKIIRSSRSVKL
jgi:plasmid stabilization system protein ParE